MKIWKLVSGILSIVLSLFIIFQSMIAGLANTLEENGEVGGSAGIIVAILLLTIGVISIVVRNSTGKGGNIAIIVLAALATITGFGGAGSYSDLKVWAGWCLIILVMAVISLFTNKKGKKTENISENIEGGK